jgi:hypothetical protein
LAGGSYLDICFEFGVAIGSFYHDKGILWGTIELLDESFQIYFPFDDVNELKAIAKGFEDKGTGNLKNIVLAIDGWVCKTRCPKSNEVRFPLSFRNRHGCFGLVVIAGCYSNKKFGMFSCVSCGSTNDILAWDFSTIKKLLEEGRLPPEYYFIGDEAFQCTQQFLVPWSGHGLPVDKDAFNHNLSSSRQVIECAFALLTERWGVLWRPLRCAFKRWTLVCSVCAKLHNYCIDVDSDADIQPRHDDDVEVGDYHDTVLNDYGDVDSDDEYAYLFDDDEDARPARPLGTRRKDITQSFRVNGIIRPVNVN